MVRRDEARPTGPRGPEQVAPRCTSPAGASPAPVSCTGAPGSRPQAGGEIPMSQAGHREPLVDGGEQERGPQHEVKPAASTHLKRGSPAAHVTAKAIPATLATGIGGAGPSGVWGAARVRHFRTGNASEKFREVDRYVAWRLKRMRMQRKGRHLKPGEAKRWTEDYFVGLGLTSLRGTIRYPGAA